jgi:putative ABC transport system permease protein
MRSALVRAWRSWAAAPGVALLAIVAIAVGIGSATAIYTVVNTILLRPFAYWDTNRYFVLFGADLNNPESRSAHNFRDLIEYRQRTRSFDVFGWLKPGSLNITYAGEPQYVSGAAVTPSLVAGLGARPTLGAWFADDSGVVLSNALWRRLGSDPAIVGRGLTVDGRPYTVTGVMAADFRLPPTGIGGQRTNPELWIRLDPQGAGQDPSVGLNFCYVRLKPGVTAAQARDDVKRVAAELAAENPAARQNYTAALDSFRGLALIEVGPILLLTSAAAGLLLLLTCADVSGLLLARAAARARETAIRIALGAGRWQLALHYFFEGLIVSLAGTALGLLVSVGLVRVILSIAADYIPRADEISFDGRVLLFAVALALVTSAASSLAPLWQAGRTAPVEVLKEGVRSSASARSRRLSRLLVVAEIALAFTLLTIGSVLLTHMSRLGRTSPGFNPNHLLTFRLARIEPAGMARQARQQDQARFTSALSAIPGVASVALSNQLPLAGCCFTTSLYPDGVTLGAEFLQRASFMAISPDYLTTMQIPLRAGRALDARDIGDDPVPVMVNEATVRTYWRGANAVGAYGRIAGPDGSRFQVVGVVGDVKNDTLGKPTVPEVYLSNALITLNPLRFVVRSTLPPATLIPEIRRAIRSIDPTQPIHGLTTMEEIADQSLALARVGSVLTTFFALAALLMAMLGIYGVVSYAVRQDSIELGTRMALGALDRELVGTVVGGGLKMAAQGIALGAIAAMASTSMVFRVFDVERIGVLPFIASATIVAVVAFAASFVPAWRVTALSPMVAIRNEPGVMWRSTRTNLAEALRGVSHAFSPARDPSAIRDDDLLTDFVAAARGASSYADAFQQSLATLRARLGAASALLLEHAGGEYRPLARTPPTGDGSGAASQEGWKFPADGFLHNRLRAYSHALPIQPGDLDSWTRWAGEARPAQLPELQALQRMGARLAVALRARDEILGILILGTPLDRDRYSHGERMLLRQCGEQLTLMIENARLTSRVVEQEKLRRDLALASEVQRRLLPEQPPDSAFAAIAAFSAPARSVGGDYYDFLDLGNHRVGIALADVAGKGVAAALIMAVVQASLRIVAADRETSLPVLAAKINDYLHRSTLSKSYATFFYAQLDEAERQLRYVNAGHNPPYLVRRSDGADGVEIRELTVGGMVLGLFPEMTWDEAVVELQRGDVLIAFTDGVTEALNTAEEEFGEARLKDVIRGTLHLPAAAISARLSEALRIWIGDTAQYDDLTFIVIKVS